MIDELISLEIGNLPQWILQKGDSDKPIYLFLHGGPGSGCIPWADYSTSALEKEFLVVHWEQRGAGKSYYPDIPVETMNFEQFVNDTHQVVTWLKDTYGKHKVVLAGNSWGTMLGMMVVNRYPEDFYAFVAISQPGSLAQNDMIGYTRTLEYCKENNITECISDLEEIGLPPWDNDSGVAIKTQWIVSIGHGTFRNLTLMMDVLGLMYDSPYWTDEEKANFGKGDEFSTRVMKVELDNYNTWDMDLTNLEIPYFLVAGIYDWQVDYESQKSLFEDIKAPRKEFITFNNSAHAPMYEEHATYEAWVIKTILPIVYENRKTPPITGFIAIVALLIILLICAALLIRYKTKKPKKVTFDYEY